MRQSSLELPTAHELREMIKIESPRRAVRRDYCAKNPHTFDDFRAVAKIAKIDAEIIDNFVMTEFDEAIVKLAKMTAEMEDFLSRNSQYFYLYDQLNCAKTPPKCDLIFVFGSPQNWRIAKAVELYKNKIAEKIWLTGRQPHYQQNELSEADRAANFAIKNGVSCDDIFIENRSIATPDNVKRSVDAWEKMRWQPHQIAFVTSEFNLRRAEMDLYKFAPWRVELFGVAPPVSDELSSRKWILSRRGRQIVLNEFAKLIMEQKIDQVVAEGGL